MTPLPIGVAATNPCHLYDLARELHNLGSLDCFYSGYPKWKLRPPPGMPIRSRSFRTCVVYGIQRLAPERLRPRSRTLFLWQDRSFDRWVAGDLQPCDFIHAMPGQCLETFRSAKRKGIRTVLNHATGPARHWVDIMRPEYERAGLDISKETVYDDAYLDREDASYELADYHCVASSIVRDQLIGAGVNPEEIWVVPYGADPRVFHPEGANRPEKFRIIFAGSLCLRKGIRTLIDALTLAGQADWTLDFYGPQMHETSEIIAGYKGAARIHLHGSVSRTELARAFQHGSALVLPSFEEGFGLVAPQALSCGLPCMVSDRVGAKDLITHRQNGSVFPSGNAESLAEELRFWAKTPRILEETHSWKSSARKLLEISASTSS